MRNIQRIGSMKFKEWLAYHGYLKIWREMIKMNYGLKKDVYFDMWKADCAKCKRLKTKLTESRECYVC